MSGRRNPKGAVRSHFELGETAVTIVAEETFLPVAKESIFRSRSIIQGFIAQDPLFKDTLEPYQEPPDAPPLIKRMCDAARKAGVGPMAAVAGTIAEAAVQAMVAAGAEHAVVDNGGDISMALAEPLVVGIYAGESAVRNLGLRILPRGDLFSVCSSSGTVGPSISFGKADAAVVLAKNAALADACATRLGNEVQSSSDEDLLRALDLVVGIEGVEGALVVVGEKVALRGNIPELVRVEVPFSAISRIELA